MARKIYSEDKMKELISRKGDGEEVPEGSKIFYYPDKIEKGGVMIPNTGPKKKVKTIIKTVSGKPRPRKGGDPGNIRSREKTNFEFKGTDIDYLRKKRKKQKPIDSKKEDFRKKEEINLRKKKFSQGGLVNGTRSKKPKGAGAALRGYGALLRG
tara:strand:- start:7 stop:468 length:462 start_codon:yes stop_codon:yes gene_type:complete